MALGRDLVHSTVYRDPDGNWNGAFPQVVCLRNGDLAVAFREAPFPPTVPVGNRAHAHGDPLARGAFILSHDGGNSWDPASYQVVAKPLGGVEQISVSVLAGDLLLAPYTRLRPQPLPVTDSAGWLHPTCSDVWVHRSVDGGRPTYAGLLLPSGRLQAYTLNIGGRRDAIQINHSDDGGYAWSEPRPIVRWGQSPWMAHRRPEQVAHGRGAFGKFYRSPWPMRLADGRIIVIFGRRKLPYGIGVLISEDEGKSWSADQVLRADAATPDLGYPVATEVEPGRIFAAYYYTQDDGNGFGGNGFGGTRFGGTRFGGTRFIAGTSFRLR